MTGGANGLGRLLAIDFAKLNAKIVVWDLDRSGLEATCNMVNQVGRHLAHSYVCDVSDHKQVYDLAERVKQEVGQVNILINNAGTVSGHRLLETTDDKIIESFKVNAMSHFWTIKAFLPDMLTASRDPNK